MAFCNKGLELIERTECIGNSLLKINNNFGAIDVAICALSGLLTNKIPFPPNPNPGDFFYDGGIYYVWDGRQWVQTTGNTIFPADPSPGDTYVIGTTTYSFIGGQWVITQDAPNVTQIVAGTNIRVSPSNGKGVVTITSLSGVTGQEVLSAENAGIFGASVYKEKVKQSLIFRKLVPGSSNVTIIEEDDYLKIYAATGSGEGGTAGNPINVGTGFGLSKPKQGDDLPFKSLSACMGISLLSSSDVVAIQVSAVSLGTGNGEIFKPTTGSAPLSFRKITGGANVDVSTVGNNVVISSSSSITGTNIGVGGGSIFAGKIGDVMQFKTIKGVGGVSIINNPNDIQISVASGGSGTVGGLVYISSVPPSNPTLGQLWFNTITGVTSVFYDATWVDVGGGDSTVSNVAQETLPATGTNLGTSLEGLSIFQAATDNNLSFKRIKEGDNVKFVETANSIIINATPIGGENTAPSVSKITGTYPIVVEEADPNTPTITIANATNVSAGAMSATDKEKLEQLVVPSNEDKIIASNSAAKAWVNFSGKGRNGTLDYVTGNAITYIPNLPTVGKTKVIVTRASGHTLSVGDWITVTNAAGPAAPGVNGTYKVDSVSPDLKSLTYIVPTVVSGNGIITGTPIIRLAIIRNAYNVTSIIKNGIGDYTLTFPEGVFTNANYVPVFGTSSFAGNDLRWGVTIKASSYLNDPVLKTTAQMTILAGQTNAVNAFDTGEINVVIFGT